MCAPSSPYKIDPTYTPAEVAKAQQAVGPFAFGYNRKVNEYLHTNPEIQATHQELVAQRKAAMTIPGTPPPAPEEGARTFELASDVRTRFINTPTLRLPLIKEPV